MKLIVIFGPPAVGKMTVGYELARLTELKLFHNHMAIDLVTNFFNWGTPGFALVGEIRKRIFEEVAANNLPGLIFTFTWNLGDPKDKEYVDGLTKIFRDKGAEIYFVELEASLKTRLKRNTTEFRLSQKPPKRDLQQSERLMCKHEKELKMNSNSDFYYRENYLKIVNDSVSAESAAMQIIDRFK